jgi:hypothetical protein
MEIVDVKRLNYKGEAVDVKGVEGNFTVPLN